MMRAYRVLLHLYPASFRMEYGEEICAAFSRHLRQASGALAVTALWAGAVFDIFINAAQVHWDILRQDMRYTARTMGRAPGFTLTAILLAGLGVGATTAAFSITDHVLIRPLPFAGAQRLVKLWQDDTSRGYSRNDVSPANYRDWKRMSTSFEAMGAFSSLSANLMAEGDPERLDGASVTAELFPLLGRQPVIGRVFAAADDAEGAPGTLLLSYGLWNRRFGGDAGVLGEKVTLDGAPYVVIGVMPRDFYFPTREAEFWTALRFAEQAFQSRTDTFLQVIAKLKPGVSLEQAKAEMGVVAAQLERTYPKENARTGITIIGLRDEISSQARLLLMVLLGASACVLLIACSNLANLLMARALVRRKELAVRAALGAGRERLVRQMLTESLTLAVCGGILGVFLAVVAAPLMVRLVPNSLPIAELPQIDLRVLLFAGLLTVATGVGFGVLPALRAFGAAAASGLREGSTGIGGRKERLRSALVIAEVTASVVLLISAGLLIRALWQIQGTDPGFRREGVLTLSTALPWSKYSKVAQRREFYTRVLAGVQALPGVSNAAYITALPMVRRGGIWEVNIEGRLEDRGETESASLRYVTPGFFKTMGIPLLMGRDVSETDGQASPNVAVVSESFVRRYWPGENPLGRRFKFAFLDRTVIGVVGDVRVRGLERNSEPQVYLSYQQVQDGWIMGYLPKDLVARTAAEPGTLVPTIRRIVASADPQQPISGVRTLADIVQAETAPRSVQVRVLGAFAAIAFLLAGIGIHGLLAFTVSTRAREIGVRIALGAQPGDILRMVLRQGVVLAAAGTVAGVGLAYAAARAMQGLLAGRSPADGMTFLAAVLLSLGMTIVGSFLPALRAARVDPMTVIRTE